MAKKVIKKPSIQDILNGGKSRSIDISNYNNYTPNDNTQVNNVIKKKYNTNRDKYTEPGLKAGGYRALKTTSGKVGTALGAVPIAVAGVPAIGSLGEVAAPTVAKIAGSLGGKLIGAGLTSAGLANGINDVSKGEYHWYTPLDLAPGVGMALNGANKTIKAYNTIKNIEQEQNINRLNLFKRNEKITNIAGKARGINDDLQSKVYRLQDNFRYGKNKYFAEAIAKKNRKLDKINDEIIARENMPEDYFHDLVDKYDNYKYQRFKYLYNKRSRKYDSADPDGFSESPFTTDRYKKAPDLRKASTENVRKFMNEHGLSAKYFEVTTDEFGRPFIKLNNNGNGAFTTGDISLTDFTTGKKYQFNIPNNTTDYGIIKPNFNYFGNNSSLHTEPWSLTKFNNGGIKKVDIPQQYKDVLQRNMEFLKNQYLGGNAKGFGSVNSVIYHDLPHRAHDYDFITTSDRLKNIQGKRIKNNGGYKRQIQSDEYGPLDVNVIDVGENGGAKNELAHEIYKELYPEKYKKFISEHINDKNVTDLELPISPEDLYQAYDEKNKSFVDMFLSNNPKHVGRFINQLNAGDTDDIVRAMEKYNEIMTGGDFKSSNIPLSEFEDPARNEEILKQLGVTNKNILNENILGNPKKMKAIVDRIIVDKTYLGRGIHTRYSDDKVKDLLIWNPDTNGGTVYGAKLNTVQGGNSTHGDLYTFIRPKEFKNPKDIKSVDDIINFENYNVGRRTLNDNEIKLAQDIAKKHNVELDKPKTLQDLLNATRNKKGLNIKNYLEEISDKLDVPAIQNGYYEVAGDSYTAPNFVSVLRDQELPSIKQYFINNADRPTTLINKSNKVGGNSDYSDNALSLLNNTWEQTKYQSHINMKKLREAENNSVDDMQSLFRRKFGTDYDKKIRIVNKRLGKELEDIKNVYEKEKAKPIRNIQMSKRVEKKIDNINGIIKNNNNRLLKLNNKINENSNNYSKYLVRSNNYKDELKNRITRNLLGSSLIGTALGIEYLNNKNANKHMRNRKKYADGGKVPYRKVWDTPEYRDGGKITNKQDAIKSYKKPIPVDKIRYTPTIGVRIPTDSELRRQKEIESLTPNERYEYRRKEAANERRNNEFKALLNGFNNTFGRAASLASLIYGGGWAANRLLRGNKATSLGQHLSRYMIPANTVDTYGDAIQFITDPSLSNGVELGAGIVGKKYRDYGKKSRQLFELGAQGLNGYNSYKFGGDVKSTPKRKYENNYIMKGTGNYVPKTPQEKVVVDLYNANYKSARKNMPREDALRQAHYRTTQQMMESGYGTSKQARKQNNFGGMGGSNSYKYNTIKDFTDHVDSTMLKNFKDSYKAPTLNKYINGLYNGRIGAYSETPIEVYSKEMKGTHPRTSKIIEQLNPDDYSFNQLNINPYYNEMLNPYVNYNRDIAKFGGCKRPKAFWGAVIGAGLSIASNLINKNAEKKAAKRQAAAEQLEQNKTAANNITTQLNEQMDNSDPYYAQFRTEFAKGGKVKGRKAVITDGGVAIPLSKNMSLLRGSTHDEINESGNTGIGINFGGNQVEAQNGEVVRKKNGKLYIYSNEPMQNGISPAKRVLNGENPDKVYNSQENYKRNHNIKTNKKYPYGGVAAWLNNNNFQGHQFTNGSLVNAGVNLLGQGINFLINKNAVNKLKYTPAPIQAQAAKLNTTYNISPQVANLERSRMRTNEDITRNTSSSVAALNRRNYANLVANDQLNSIYNTKNEAEHKMINEDRMNEQNVRNNNIQQYNAWNAQRTEFENSKKLAKAQNYSNLVNGISSTISSTINEARKAYLDDQNLKAAAAPYGDGVIADLARNGVYADSLYVDRLRKLGNPKTPYDDALRTLYINSIQDPRLRYEFENDPEFAIPTPGNENYTIGRLNNINLGNTNPIEQSMINNNNYLQSKLDNDWWTRMGKRQFRFPILNTYNNKSFIKVPYRA